MQQDPLSGFVAGDPGDCCLERFRAVLRVRGGRLTREREALVQAVCDQQDHFQPEQVEQLLTHRGYRVSLSTIYRNLPLLVEAGIIRRACLEEEKGGGGTRYEHVWGREHHDHLVCSHCGKRVEFSYPAIDILQNEVARQHGYRLQRHHLELIGICPNCQDALPQDIRIAEVPAENLEQTDAAAGVAGLADGAELP